MCRAWKTDVSFMERAELIQHLKVLIIDTLRLEEMRPEDLADNEPLVGGGLELDSIDALEVVVRLEKEFQVKITTSEETKQALASVEALADFILAQAK